MRISATGSEAKADDSAAGFTLVEVMVALAVLALMTGVVVLSLPPPDSELRNEMRQLAARLQMAAEESVIGGEMLGFDVSARGYEFFRFRQGEWKLIADDRIFAPHGWDAPTYVAVDHGSHFPVRETDDEEDDATPTIRFDPTGTPSHFSIDVERGEHRLFVRSAAGRIEVSDADH